MTVKLREYEIVTLQGDMMTPISIYHAVRGRKKMLFESSAKHEESGRYSFIALNPIAELKSTENGTEIIKNGKRSELQRSPMDVLKEMLPLDTEDYPFAFFGGAIGYIGYDTAFYFEKIGSSLPDELEMPNMHMLFYDTFIIYDHLQQTVSIVAIDLFKGSRTSEAMQASIQNIVTSLHITTVTQPEAEEPSLQFKSSIDQKTFCHMVETAQEYIKKGDIFQVVLSQRFSSPFTGNPFSLYRKLRTSNPSPYMFYMDFEEYIILGTSPESLVKVKNRLVTTNPIAGTRPRGQSVTEDAALAEGLLADAKEIAEHRMLVDLGRNDIGKLSKIGTVKLPKYMDIEYYKYVMHIVSEVTGELQDDIHVLDVLATCLPAGTVSGAPKIRAMQIINELETMKRGVYAGAVGYISVSGDMDMALAIRTMVVRNDKAHVQAGAGIVYNSEAKSEYEETLNKAKALLEVRK
ncbi:anthranilate synthase component I [Viridibacillus sp. YIM B01967]|uniref:Anthranilate synthase component 1 n=1 Tax=Viridibacillus soli TaxID=2798301 RepID=A0ABS1HBD5_9BACL|nr:anthranilate synthase component I [Viridibacillus soli]MBK3496293.1 anthranilate synthase component I [Viridibacillus soli]